MFFEIASVFKSIAPLHVFLFWYLSAQESKSSAFLLKNETIISCPGEEVYPTVK